MARQTGNDRKPTRQPTVLSERDNPQDIEPPRIESDGRFAVDGDASPDPRTVIDDLRRRLRIEQEKSLNSVDAVVGARAVAAQAKAETQEVFYRLHVRETELNQLKELTAGPSSPAGAQTRSGRRPAEVLRSVGSTRSVGSADANGWTGPKAAARSLVAAARRLAANR